MEKKPVNLPPDPKLLDTAQRALERADQRFTRRHKTVSDAIAPGGVNQLVEKSIRLPGDVWEQFLFRLVTQRALAFRTELEATARTCESPIEEMLFLALALVGERASDEGVIVNGSEPGHFDNLSTICILPQVPIGKYRIDFEVTALLTQFRDDLELIDWHRGQVLVECDGHDFHERTKEQASRDKRKDRELQRAGFTVFRYTGSDVWKDCMGVAEEIVAQAVANALAAPPVASEPRKQRPEDLL